MQRQQSEWLWIQILTLESIMYCVGIKTKGLFFYIYENTKLKVLLKLLSSAVEDLRRESLLLLNRNLTCLRLSPNMH